MPYNTAQSAQDITGEELRTGLLEVARALIDQRSPYRWEETTVTEIFSGNGKYSLMLKRPIVEIVSFTIDSGDGPVAQVAGTDYEVRKQKGEVYVYAGLPEGFDNVQVNYKYGFTGEHQSYKAVLLAEAQIALYLQKNPAMLKDLQLGGQGGVTLSFGEGIAQYLALIPRPAGFTTPD